VSGASRGIGQAIALRLVEEGVSVFITAEADSGELTSSAALCKERAQHGADARSGVFDLAQEGAAERMVAAAVEAYGRVDILVNKAGIGGPALFGAYVYDTFNATVAVNLPAPFFASQAVIPVM